MSEVTAPSFLDEDSRPSNKDSDTEKARGAREQDVRDLGFNDNEEKTAEVNEDDEFFVSGHLIVEDGLWDSAYNFHLQRASSVPCPICLCVTTYPARQECGHVLCHSCIQQSLSFLGNCSLCQAQQMFKAGNTEVIPGPETIGISYASAWQDLHLPISSSVMLSTPCQGAIVQFDHIHANNSSNTVGTAVSTDDDVSRVHHDLLSNSSHVSLGLDNLSDLEDVIDLDDLVSPDSEQLLPPVAAKTSRSQSFIEGPARHPRTSLRKMSTYSFGHASATSETTTSKALRTVARATASQVSKRKARARKPKREDLAIARMEWEMVRTEGSPPGPRYDCGMAIHGNVVIVVGGIIGKLRLNDLHILDLAAKPLPRWTQPPIDGTPPPPGHLLQIFVIEDDLYAIGGTIDGKFLTELHRLNFEEWKWEKLEVAGNPPSMRYWYSLAVLQGMAILYGGYGHPQRLSDTFALRFDTEMPTWMELQPRGNIPGHLSTHSVCVINDRMYLFGGYDGKYRRGQVFAFEIEDVFQECIECVWRKVETRGHGPASRYTHSGASIGSQLIVYGGNTGCLKGDAYVLDLQADATIPSWKLVKCDSPLIPRAWHRALTWNGAMYVFGGTTTDGPDNSVMRVAFPTD